MVSETLQSVLANEVSKHPGSVPVQLKIGKVVRQGDVLIEKISALPNGITARNRRDLAPGSAHSHIAEEPAETFDSTNGDIYIRSSQPFVIEHPTHKHFVLPSGNYRTWRQVEATVDLSGRVLRRRVRD